MNEKIWIIANWKANKNIKEALEWISVVGPEIPKEENLKVVVCPAFVETDEIIAQKVKKAKEANIIPLVCVQGEDVSVPDGCKLVAYEPVWAIGTGNCDTPENAAQVAGNIKQKYGEDLEILYGGSVTSQNVKNFIKKENISGVLIGGASLNPQEFVRIVKECVVETP